MRDEQPQIAQILGYVHRGEEYTTGKIWASRRGSDPRLDIDRVEMALSGLDREILRQMRIDLHPGRSRIGIFAPGAVLCGGGALKAYGQVEAGPFNTQHVELRLFQGLGT